MRFVLVLAALASLGHWSAAFGSVPEPACASQPGVIEATIPHEGRSRQFTLYRPENLPPDAPLVMMVHGFGSSAKTVMDGTGLNDVADHNQFAVVYPQGLKVEDVISDSEHAGFTFWNSNPDWGIQVDDVAFLSELAAHLESECNLGTDRRFVVGHSNGAAMTYTMACLAPDLFNAVASVAGAEEYACESPRAVPVLHIHGVQDDVIPIDGTASEGEDKPLRSIRESVEFWAAANNSEALSEQFIAPATTVYRYSNSVDDNEVWYYRIEGWGHDWPKAADNTGTDAAEVIWQFFSRY
ncbi:MAG: alpha/beta hydrolase family esterase [Woeseiaceae bacterium]